MKRKTTFNYFIAAGIVGPLFYFFLLALLGYMWSGYNPIVQSMSEIGSVVSPYKSVMNYLGFSTLGVCISIFGIGLSKEFKRSMPGKISFLLLMVAGIAMLFVGFFPCDAGCVDVTITGTMHSLFSMLPSVALPFAAMVIANDVSKRWGMGWGIFSFWMGILSVFSGPLMFLPETSPYLGLLQRVGIGFSLVWMVTVSAKIILDQPRTSYEK